MIADMHRFRLAGMMFGQYLIVGSWVVTLATFLMNSPLQGGLNFPPSYTSWIYSTLAFAGILAPAFIGILADRLFPAEKLMGCFHIAGGILLALAALWCIRQQPLIENDFRTAAAAEYLDGKPILEWELQFDHDPERSEEVFRTELKNAFERVNKSVLVRQRIDETFLPLFLLMFAYSFCYIITLTLCNVISFRNLHDPQHSFGQVRLFGTVGWIVAGVQLELFWNTASAAPLLVAGVMSVVFGLFCFQLPHTPPAGNHRTLAEAFGLPALTMFRERSFTVLIACTFGIAAVQQFYSIYTNRFLTELHVPYPAAVQTVAQVAEVGCMLLLPVFIRRFGLKMTMAFGLLCWIGRNAVFAGCSVPFVIAAGLPMHGMSYTFFIIVAALFVDRRAPLRLRASAQAIFTCVTFGAGTLVGNGISARVVASQTVGDIVMWPVVWMVPTIVSGFILLAFLALFRESDEVPVRSPLESG